MEQRFIKETFDVYFKVTSARSLFSNTIIVDGIEPLDEATTKLQHYLSRPGNGIMWNKRVLLPITQLVSLCQTPNFSDLPRVIVGTHFRSRLEYGGEEFTKHMMTSFPRANWVAKPLGEFYGATLIDPNAGISRAAGDDLNLDEI